MPDFYGSKELLTFTTVFLGIFIEAAPFTVVGQRCPCQRFDFVDRNLYFLEIKTPQSGLTIRLRGVHLCSSVKCLLSQVPLPSRPGVLSFLYQ